jgi:hypothetical protein
MSSRISISLATSTALVEIRERRFNGPVEIGLPDTEREIVVAPLEEPVPAVPDDLPLPVPEPEKVPA